MDLRRIPARETDILSDPVLVTTIRDEIGRAGPMTFARFMELALYDPARGYYRGAVARPGREGDFLTAPEAHPIFGAALSRAVGDAWDRLARGIKILSAAGVKFGVGTDGGGQTGDQFVGWTMHAELENLVAAGMTPTQVIQAATRNSAGKCERGSV